MTSTSLLDSKFLDALQVNRLKADLPQGPEGPQGPQGPQGPEGPCASNPNTPPSKTPNCSQYGGPHDESYCDSMFSDDPEANKSCKDILWGVFGQVGCTNDSGYPANLFIKEKKEITCPSKLTSVLVEN